ncbi:hypothetical protein DSO57_1030737 [Entomophthora muscae]|uniref:Uncharacterized protein n=1 Tax=Entomophthora muscae TaxID=34485 RepID=A0ACC2S2Q6_9FUNG|nr:hypothetical protein DSO57_1030737 [Entomophthora muscae]
MTLASAPLTKPLQWQRLSFWCSVISVIAPTASMPVSSIPSKTAASPGSAVRLKLALGFNSCHPCLTPLRATRIPLAGTSALMVRGCGIAVSTSRTEGLQICSWALGAVG